MDKIEQFIKKNKGCPMTPASTKQLLTKFMEFMDKELPGISVDSLKDKDVELGNVIAYTLEQKEPNWESEITIKEHTGGEDYQVTLTYGKCVLIANTLHIVAIVKAVNNGSSSVTHPHILFNKISIPSFLKGKIYDMDGKSLEEVPLTTNCPITSSTRCARGNLNAWTSRFAHLDNIAAKLFRDLNSSDVTIEAKEGLPTLNAGDTGYLIVGFDLVII